MLPDTLPVTSDHYVILQARIDTLGRAHDIWTLGCEGEKDALCTLLGAHLAEMHFVPAARAGKVVETSVVLPAIIRRSPVREVRLGTPVVDQWHEERCAYRGRIFGSGELTGTDRPVVRVKQEPAYPPAAAADSVTGSVLLRVIVDPDGVPCFAVCDAADPVGMGFVEAAVRAVRQWRFEPGRLDGEPQAVWLEIPFRWSP